ncbi:hypothetical protein HID58_027181 [Brassica napus]|uniref:Uncharacterized protein n=1 Tax=Brassica napus TaxID=3708 RepID=A0ABQ8CTD5_BRANA|nr:hypothetical protein HID58_027181 [Brassica napus]
MMIVLEKEGDISIVFYIFTNRRRKIDNKRIGENSNGNLEILMLEGISTISPPSHPSLTKAWISRLSSFSSYFLRFCDLGLLRNHTKALCLSAGAGHAPMAMAQIELSDVTAVELVDSLPLERRADPHNLHFSTKSNPLTQTIFKFADRVHRSVVREIAVASSDLAAASYDLAAASYDLAVASSDLFVASSNLAVASSDLAGQLCRVVQSRRRTRHRRNPSPICEMMRFDYREM